MNEIEVDSSCYFIYQNASPNTKSEIGRTKFTDKLNKFTKNAAIEENIVKVNIRASMMSSNMMTQLMLTTFLDYGKEIHLWPQLTLDIVTLLKV